MKPKGFWNLLRTRGPCCEWVASLTIDETRLLQTVNVTPGQGLCPGPALEIDPGPFRCEDSSKV